MVAARRESTAVVAMQASERYSKEVKSACKASGVEPEAVAAGWPDEGTNCTVTEQPDTQSAATALVILEVAL